MMAAVEDEEDEEEAWEAIRVLELDIEVEVPFDRVRSSA